MMQILQTLRLQFLYVAWFQAAVATAGSLFFSEVMKLPPCVLCWYQRIAMYPLVFVLAVAILRRDEFGRVGSPSAARAYGLPLALGGLGIAVYHNLLYYKWIPDSIKPCTSGVSCTAKQIEWAGFLTIPLLSLVAFLIIVVCLIFATENKSEGSRS